MMALKIRQLASGIENLLLLAQPVSGNMLGLFYGPTVCNLIYQLSSESLFFLPFLCPPSIACSSPH